MQTPSRRPRAEAFFYEKIQKLCQIGERNTFFPFIFLTKAKKICIIDLINFRVLFNRKNKM